MRYQNRWKSKTLWVSIASLILYILKAYNLLDVLQLSSEEFNTIVDLLLGIMVMAGILSSPTHPPEKKDNWKKVK